LQLSIGANKAKKMAGIPLEIIENEKGLKAQIQKLEKNFLEMGKSETHLDSLQKEV
jgi:hypothetical protein